MVFLNPAISLDDKYLIFFCSQVANDSTFSRDGSDIYVDANISFTQVSTLVIPESWVIVRVVPSKLLFFMRGDFMWSKVLTTTPPVDKAL